MRRETRANLLFLVIFLIVSVPGAVILFKKKMDPAAPPLFMPDYVKTKLPYMAPQRTPDSVVRYVPELTGQWVQQLTKAHGITSVLMRGHVPVESDDRIVQLIDLNRDQLALLIWADDFVVTGV